MRALAVAPATTALDDILAAEAFVVAEHRHIKRVVGPLAPQYALALARLVRSGHPMTVTDFGNDCLFERNPTYAISRMVAAGVVTVTPRPGDRRSNVVEITDAGRAIVERLEAHLG